MRAILPRTVVILGLVSMLNDAASEMIAPLLPIFLTATLGAGPAIVGLVEGVAEATASVLKLVSGRLADRGFGSKRLVLGGYGVSNAARPLIGLALGWGYVLVLRFLDRVGKGIRTAPRDALIAAATDAGSRGRAFGYHRAMDHAGAMIGPLLAFGLLGAGLAVEEVFIASVVPGLFVVLLIVFGIPSDAPAVPRAPPPMLSWRTLDARVRGLIVAAGGLALAAVPEVFLILWASARGMEVVWLPLVWAAASGVKMLLAAPAGYLSDRLGRLPLMLTGWGLRIVLLLLLAFADNGMALVWGLFLAYSGALAISEPAERSLIGDLAPEGQKATAYGVFHLASGLLALPGALLFGGLWELFGERVAFLTAAAMTVLAAVALLRVWTAGQK